MFEFLRRSGMRRPSDALCRALVADGLPDGVKAAELGVVERRGSYAGRQVTFFRVFDPVPVAALGDGVLAGLAYGDLDAHPALVLRAGFVERNGTVVISVRQSDLGVPVPAREQADRSRHADDEKVVFPDRGGVAP